MATEPSDDVTVTVARRTEGDQDTDLSVVSGTALTFTRSDWDTYQNVTLRAAQDDDADAGSAVFVHTADGGGYGAVDATLTATESDDDAKGIVLSSTGVTVPEGGTATYQVRLAARPVADVTVAVAHRGDSGDDADLSVAAGSSLTFTASDWNADQTVTLAAAEDIDGVDGSAVIEHTASGGGYGSVTAELLATESDNDNRHLELSATSLTVPEGSTATYEVRLASRPGGDVTVTVAPATGGDPDLQVATGASLAFTVADWSTYQTVTLAAAQDDDAVDGTASFLHSATGGGYSGETATVTATESDDDTRGLVFSSSSVTVAEGSTADYRVRLATRPTAAVTVAVARKVGDDQDADLAVKTGASLTFTTANWNTDQTVTLAAAQDDDAVDGTATFLHSATGGGYSGETATVTATESDDDTRGLVFSPSSVTVAEGSTADYGVRLATRPTAAVTVAVARKAGDDQDADLAVKTGASLTFTIANWSADQTVTLEAAEDEDGDNGTATFVHTAAGGDYAGLSADVQATESDNDDKDLELETPEATVTEGISASYAVALATEPAGTVTVTLTVDDPDAATVSPTSLTFDASNWNIEQDVTVTAVEDADGRDEIVTVIYTATGGGYEGWTSTWEVILIDDDRGLSLSAAELTLHEDGDAATYTVALAAEPGATVAVAVDVPDGLTATPRTLEFGPSNWDQAQTVALAAPHDADGFDDSATVVHSPSGDGYGEEQTEVLLVSVVDDDRALVVSNDAVEVSEGASTSYSLRLATRPTADVEVAIAIAGDPDLSMETADGDGSAQTRRFTPANWSDPQPVTVLAAEDHDGVAGRALIRHEASGGGYDAEAAEVRATEVDNDALGLVFEPAALTLREGESADYQVRLATSPSADVSVSLSWDDATVSASPASLDFEAGAWPAEARVTLSVASGDGSGADRSVSVVHSASGGEYEDLSGDVALDIEADRHPSFGASAHIADQRYTQNRRIPPLTLPQASGGDGALVYALTPTLPAGLEFDAAARVLSGTPSARSPVATYTYTATDADARGPDRAALTFTIEVVATPAKDVLEDALASQGRALLTSATGVIGERFRAGDGCSERDTDEGGKRNCAGAAVAGIFETLAASAPRSGFYPDAGGGFGTGLPGLGVGGTFGGAGGARWPASGIDPGMRGSGTGFPRSPGDWMRGPERPSLAGRFFSLGVGGNADAPGRWTLWGAGDLQTFDGAIDAGTHRGDLSSLYLGVDRCFGECWLAGAALSRHRGETDYSVADGDIGRLDLALTAIHPYVRGTLDSGLALWAMAGFGRGDVEVERHSPLPLQGRSDLDMTLAAFGARQGLIDWRGLELAAVGDAGRASLSTAAGEDFVNGLSATATRARLALELGRPSSALAPYLQMGGRYDGGDGRTGLGVEVAAGVRHAGPRFAFEARGRWLTAATDQPYEEYGAMARIELKPGTNGTGWTLALAPVWGNAAGTSLLGEPGGLDQADAFGMAGGVDSGGIWHRADRTPRLSLDGQLGYAFRWPGGGLVSPVLIHRQGDGWSTLGTGVSYQSLRTLFGRPFLAEFAFGARQDGMGATTHEAMLQFTLLGSPPLGSMSTPPPRTSQPGQPAPMSVEPDPPPAPPADVAPELPPGDHPAGPPPSAPPAENSISLLALPESHYAIQLMAMATRPQVERYAAKHDLPDAFLASIERDGETLHILLAGIYPDMDRAREAAEALASTLPDITPWVRKLGPLQRAMRSSAEN